MELLLTSFLSIDNFCSIKLKLLWPPELATSNSWQQALTYKWITSNSWQQALSYINKRQSILAHKYKITFLLIFLNSSNFLCTKFESFWLFEFTSHCWQQALSWVNNNRITWINLESSGKEAQLDKDFTIVSRRE